MNPDLSHAYNSWTVNISFGSKTTLIRRFRRNYYHNSNELSIYATIQIRALHIRSTHSVIHCYGEDLPECIILITSRNLLLQVKEMNHLNPDLDS